MHLIKFIDHFKTHRNYFKLPWVSIKAFFLRYKISMAQHVVIFQGNINRYENGYLTHAHTRIYNIRECFSLFFFGNTLWCIASTLFMLFLPLDLNKKKINHQLYKLCDGVSILLYGKSFQISQPSSYQV